MKRHLKSHSYKEANYKCEDCDFVSKHTLTMEVHMGKLHLDKLECGICEMEAKDMEALETHLHTCEIYQCQCGKKCKLLQDVKKHIKEEHKEATILHLKMDRDNSEEFSETMYWSESI